MLTKEISPTEKIPVPISKAFNKRDTVEKKKTT